MKTQRTPEPSVPEMTGEIHSTERTERERAHLASIVEFSNDAILSETLEGIIVSWNVGAERMFGYTAEEMVGQSILLLVPPELRDEEDLILGNIKAGKGIEHYETERLTKPGHRVPVSLTISPLKDAGGRIIGASKIARDITERKQAENWRRASEENYRILFDLCPVAVYSCEASGVIRDFNHRAAELWGRSPKPGIPRSASAARTKCVLPTALSCLTTNVPWPRCCPERSRRRGTWKSRLSVLTARESPSSSIFVH